MPIASPSVKIPSHAPIEGRAKSAVRQRDFSHCVSAERADSTKSVNLVNDVPNAMQTVANDKHNREPETKDTEHSKQNDRSHFKSPRFLVPEVRSECQIKCRDCNQE